MFLSEILLPDGVSDYEVHQHLYCQFDRDERGYLYKREGNKIKMLSVERPKRHCRKLDVMALSVMGPMPFSADLIITRCKFIRGEKGQRYDVRDHEERRQWLRRQLQDVADVPFVRFRDRMITIKGGTRRLVASCTGTLAVRDRYAFARILQAGVGRGKAFGCGLIWIPEVME